MRESVPRATRGGLEATATVFGFSAVALQRFGFGEEGSVQATTVLAVLLVVFSLFVFRQRVSISGVLLFGLLLLSGSVSFVLSPNSSFSSFGLLLTTYLLTIVGPDDDRQYGRRFMSGVARACTLGAFLGIVQFILQATGRGYFDPVRELPSAILRTGFNSYYGTQFSSGVATSFKPNGVLFLEPSFLSLYSAIGLVYIVAKLFSPDRSWRWWHVLSALVLAGGFAASASASGVVVLAFAALPLAAQFRRNWLIAAMGVVLLVGLWQAGLFEAVATKTADVGAGSSTALRLYLPYRILAPYWLESPLFGSGPGATTEIISGLEFNGLQASTLMKALVEYGVVGTVIIFAIVFVALRRSRAGFALCVAAAAAWLIPAEALLNSTLVMIILFGLATWTNPHRSRALTLSTPDDVAVGSVERR